MNVWDAELLTNSKKPMPVTDGLIFWLDGQDTLYGDTVLEEGTNNTPTLYQTAHMFDRVNGHIVNFSGTAGIRSDGQYIYCAYKTDQSSGRQAGTTSVTFSDIVTVEFVAASPASFYLNKLEPSGNYLQYPQGVYGCANIKTSNLSAGSPMTQIVGTAHATTGYARLYQDGIDKTVYPQTASVFSPFSASAKVSFRWAARFGSYRLYNRALSEAEILQNLAYEKSVGRVLQ